MMNARWLFGFFLLCLTACQPDHRTQSRTDLREIVAAMKVATQGASYQEFRERRLAIETYYEAHQKELPTREFETLKTLMLACDNCWRRQLDHPFEKLTPEADLILIDTINPDALQSLMKDWDNRTQHREYYADYPIKEYTRLALRKISQQCDTLLASL